MKLEKEYIYFNKKKIVVHQKKKAVSVSAALRIKQFDIHQFVYLDFIGLYRLFKGENRYAKEEFKSIIVKL